MLRVLLFFIVLMVLAFADAWFIERPGQIVLTWQGYHVETSLSVGIGVVLGLAVAFMLIWALLRFVFRIPGLMSNSQRGRRRDKGYAALSRGMIAVGAGDAQLARKFANEAQKYLRNEPLALLLRAQAAQLANQPEQAAAAFKQMTERDDMRLLGLRGLHVEAQRRGDFENAHNFASAAHEIAPLPWTAKAGVEHRAATGDWQSALAALESNFGAQHVDKTTRERQRAVLETALALDKEETAPSEALRLVRAALKREPHFVPAVALAARLLSRKGDIRKATKLIEAAWPRAPQPDLAKLYLDMRPGESNADRLTRARTLARLAPNDPESKLTVAQVAIAACDYKAARDAMQSLIEGAERPTARTCLIMAELEEAEHGPAGYVREWLARASRAPHDPAWVADGVVSDKWLPASPVTGKLDAFVWRRPIERLSAGGEAEEAIFAPVLAPPPPPVMIEEAKAPALAPPKPEGEPEQASAATTVENGSPEPPAIEPSANESTLSRPVIFPLPAAPDDPGQEQTPKPRGLLHLF